MVSSCSIQNFAILRLGPDLEPFLSCTRPILKEANPSRSLYVYSLPFSLFLFHDAFLSFPGIQVLVCSQITQPLLVLHVPNISYHIHHYFIRDHISEGSFCTNCIPTSDINPICLQTFLLNRLLFVQFIKRRDSLGFFSPFFLTGIILSRWWGWGYQVIIHPYCPSRHVMRSHAYYISFRFPQLSSIQHCIRTSDYLVSAEA